MITVKPLSKKEELGVDFTASQAVTTKATICYCSASNCKIFVEHYFADKFDAFLKKKCIISNLEPCEPQKHLDKSLAINQQNTIAKLSQLQEREICLEYVGLVGKSNWLHRLKHLTAFKLLFSHLSQNHCKRVGGKCCIVCKSIHQSTSNSETECVLFFYLPSA